MSKTNKCQPPSNTPLLKNIDGSPINRPIFRCNCCTYNSKSQIYTHCRKTFNTAKALAMHIKDVHKELGDLDVTT